MRFKTVTLALAAVCLLAGCGDKNTAETSAAPTPQTTKTQAAETQAPATVKPSQLAPAGQAQGISVVFINVGRADAAVVLSGSDAYLIDTGEEISVPALYRGLELAGVENIKGVFLTHAHSDHIGGMEALTQKYEVETLYSAEISMDKDNGGNKIESLAIELWLTHKKLSAGDTVDIGQGAYFEVLGPLTCNAEDDNDNSLVMKLHAGGFSVLFAGDMQFAEEATLLSSHKDLRADVLKVGNHGNPDATSEAFAKAVGAKTAVISTSTAADADTPAASVISALGKADVYVTQDYDCGVKLTFDGGIRVSALEAKPKAADVRITQINTVDQTVSLVNKGKKTDISGYFLFSEKGGEVFVFPEGAVMEAGQTVIVACLKSRGDYSWNEKKVWSDKDGEAGVLYDRFGNELSRMEKVEG